MKVRDLLELLRDVDPDREVIVQKDAEGNDYSPLAGVDDESAYEADSTWSGTAYHEDDEDRAGVPALVLYPVN